MGRSRLAGYYDQNFPNVLRARLTFYKDVHILDKQTGIQPLAHPQYPLIVSINNPKKNKKYFFVSKISFFLCFSLTKENE